MLVAYLSLLVVPLAIIPYVPTQTPAAHSKDWVVRSLCSMAIMIVPFVGWRKLLRSWTLVDLAILGFVVCHVISALVSGRVAYCFLEHWQTIVWIGLGWLVYRLQPTVADLRKVTAVVAFAGAACALYGVLSYAGLDVLGWLYQFRFTKTEEGGRNYIHSFFGNPEYFGGYAAPVSLLCFSRCLQPQVSLRVRAAWVGASAMLLLALGLSGSRGAFLGVLIGGILLIARQLPTLGRHALKRVLLVLGIGMISGIALVVLFSTPNAINRRDMQLAQRFAEAVDLRSASIRERLFFYALTARAVNENPVWGAGPGTYRLDFFPNMLTLEQSDPNAATEMMAKELRNRLAEHPHNDYLEYWYELGTAGVAFLLLLISLVFARFFMNHWRTTQATVEDVHLQVLNAGMTAAIVCLLVNAAFSFPLHLPARGSLFWILTGCFFASDLAMRTNNGSSTKMPLAHGAKADELRKRQITEES
ncbi:MAG: O-antigen ligase family protein [Candidatus Sumerlaeaceae bacterium]